MEYPLDNQASWKNEVRRRQRASTLKTYVYSEIGHLPVSGVTTALVPKILRPIWTTKSGTASGVRGPAGRPAGAVTLTQPLVRAQQNRFLVDKDNPEHLWTAAALSGIVEHHGADIVQNVMASAIQSARADPGERAGRPIGAESTSIPASARHLTHGAHLSPWVCEQLRA